MKSVTKYLGKVMEKTILKSCISLLLGVLFYYFSSNGLDYLPPLVYWICIAMQLTIYFEFMAILWRQKSVFFKSGYKWYYLLFLIIFYCTPPVAIIIMQTITNYRC